MKENNTPPSLGEQVNATAIARRGLDDLSAAVPAHLRHTYDNDGGQCPYQVAQLFSKRLPDCLDIFARTHTNFSGADVVEKRGVLHQDGFEIRVP